MMSMGHSALLLEALRRRQRCTNKRLECGTRDVKIEHMPPTWHGIGYHFGKERESERPEWSRVSAALNGFSPLCQMSFAAVCCGRFGGGGLSGAYLDSFMGGSRRQSHEPPELPHQTGDIALHKRQQKMLSS